MFDDIMSPPCQVPDNILLWRKKSPNNMTGVHVEGSYNHAVADTGCHPAPWDVQNRGCATTQMLQ